MKTTYTNPASSLSASLAEVKARIQSYVKLSKTKGLHPLSKALLVFQWEAANKERAAIYNKIQTIENSFSKN